MPAVSEKQRVMMAIAEHEPEKLYKRNKAAKKMSKEQLHDFAKKRKTGSQGKPGVETGCCEGIGKSKWSTKHMGEHLCRE
jgi:hypothetical protein